MHDADAGNPKWSSMEDQEPSSSRQWYSVRYIYFTTAGTCGYVWITGSGMADSDRYGCEVIQVTR